MLPTLPKTARSKLSPEISPHGREVETPHTKLLRVSLLVEESSLYWQQRSLAWSKAECLERAFEERWFGNKSMSRVRSLLNEFGYRYDSYPNTLKILVEWQPRDWLTRQNICHWHLQLTDPLYRSFTDVFLNQRRIAQNPMVNRDIVARWVTQQQDKAWSVSTTNRMATGLIASAAEAGLCSGETGDRSLSFSGVSDQALTYWLYVLKDLSFQGTLLNNPYWRSMGLTGSILDQRLGRLSCLEFRRLADVYEFNWEYPDLTTWAISELGLERVNFQEAAS